MRTVSRREFLRTSVLVAASGLATACAVPAPTQAPGAATGGEAPLPSATGPTAPAAPLSQSKESPQLAEQVQAGALPPVEERLPLDPLVLEPEHEVGTYGGTWRFGASGTSHWVQAGINEGFIRMTRDGMGWRPNLVSSWEWSEDATELTLNFRKGIKWSNGTPFTVDDWIFWWEDLAFDDNVPIAPTRGCVVNGEQGQISRIDDYTIKLSWAGTNPLFLEIVSAGGSGNRSVSFQVVSAEYMKQFHPKYNTQVAAGDTNALVDHYNNRINYPDTPYLNPWVTVEHRVDERILAERNPYYWKVDPEGNQLPYIDGVDVSLLKTSELILLKCVNGEADMQLRELNLQDTSVLMGGAEAGGYEAQMWEYGLSNRIGIHIYYCYSADPAIAELLWNQKFRQALSWAIDRERINDVIFFGLGRPRQAAMYEGAPAFQTPRGQEVLQQWEAQCVEHQPETAMSLLDEIGVVDVDGDGFREKPDGSPLELVLDVSVTATVEVSAMQLIKEDWAAVGLNLVLNVIDGTVLDQRMQQCESMLRSREIGGVDLSNGPYHWAPVEAHNGVIGGYPYGRYFQTGGKEGLPAPEGSFLEKLQQIYAEAILIPDEAERTDRLLDAFQVHIDEGPIQIGCIGGLKVPVVVKKGLRNVIANGRVASWVYGLPAMADPEQWYWAQA